MGYKRVPEQRFVRDQTDGSYVQDPEGTYVRDKKSGSFKRIPKDVYMRRQDGSFRTLGRTYSRDDKTGRFVPNDEESGNSYHVNTVKDSGASRRGDGSPDRRRNNYSSGDDDY